jgi:Domain of unknown function (DUF4386)
MCHCKVFSAVAGGASPHTRSTRRDTGTADPGDTASAASTAWDSTSAVFFCLSVLILNYLLYRSRLVPRLISGWALAAVAPYLIDGLLVIFGLLSTSSPLHTVLIVPLALNEMVLALWLLTKGFRPQSSEWTTAPSVNPPIKTAVQIFIGT